MLAGFDSLAGLLSTLGFPNSESWSALAMKVSIDRSKCTGYANCVDAARDVFEMGPDDIAIVLVEETSDEEQVARVRSAARLCPVKAVLVDEA